MTELTGSQRCAMQSECLRLVPDTCMSYRLVLRHIIENELTDSQLTRLTNWLRVTDIGRPVRIRSVGGFPG